MDNKECPKKETFTKQVWMTLKLILFLAIGKRTKKPPSPTLTKNKKIPHFPLQFQNKSVSLPKNKFCITIKR